MILIIGIIFTTGCYKPPQKVSYIVKDTIYVTVIDTIYLHHYVDTIVERIIIPYTSMITSIDKICIPNNKPYYSKFSKLGITINIPKRKTLSDFRPGLQYHIIIPKPKVKKPKHSYDF